MSMKAAAVLLYPGCTVSEVIELATRVSNAGHDVLFISPEGQSIRDQSGVVLQPDSGLAATAPQLDALILPGGDIRSVYGAADVQSFVRQAQAGGAVIGAICAGVLIAADAGVLAGRRITHNYRAPWAGEQLMEFAAPLLSTATTEVDVTVGVVKDGNLITALPNATAEFAMTVCQSLGIYDDERAALLTRHLQGRFVPDLFSRGGS